MQTEELDELPFATDVYENNLTIEKYNVPFLLNPFVSFYTARGCPALCTFCLWPQTLSGHAWRVRSVENVAREFRQAHKMFPQAKEFFFDDDTFNIRKDRVLALCKEFKPVGFQWSCTARDHSDYETLKAMADAGCRLLIVGFESGDAQILKNIKKGATVEMGRTFVKNCKKVGIHVHGDFIIGLPGETKETIEKTIDYAKELDCETIQVSMAHAYPGTELYDQGMREGFLAAKRSRIRGGHQLPHLEYPGLSREYMVDAVNRFYDSYYFRPRVAWRIVREALWDGHERKRLFHEAVDFLKLRADRKKVARGGRGKKGGCCCAADRTQRTNSELRANRRAHEVAAGPAFQDVPADCTHDCFRPGGRRSAQQGHEAHRRRDDLGAGRTPSPFSFAHSRRA